MNRHKMKRLRIALGLSFADAALRAGMSRSQWWNIESGKQKGLTLDNAESIARALEVALTDIVSPSDRRKRS